jgi:MraZ protein
VLSGALAHAVDAKGRTILPSRFRGQMGAALWITKGVGRCLWVFTQERWTEVIEKLTSGSMMDPDLLDLQRHFLGWAVEEQPDEQGRIALPALLRQYAFIEREVVTAGVGNRLEIWARDRWDAYQDTLTDERIAQLGAKVRL